MEARPNIKQQKSTRSFSTQEISAVHNVKTNHSTNSANDQAVKVDDSGTVPKQKTRDIADVGQSSRVKRSSFPVVSDQEKQNVSLVQGNGSTQEIYTDAQINPVTQNKIIQIENKGQKRKLSLKLKPKNTKSETSNTIVAVQKKKGGSSQIQNKLKVNFNKQSKADQKRNGNTHEQNRIGSVKNSGKFTSNVFYTENINSNGLRVTQEKTIDRDIANGALRKNNNKLESSKIVHTREAASIELSESCYSEINITSHNHVEETATEKVDESSSYVATNYSAGRNKEQMIFELKKNGYSSPFEDNGQASQYIRSDEYMQQTVTKNILHNYEDLHKFISQEIEAELNKNWIQLGEMSSPSSPEDVIYEENSNESSVNMNMPLISSRVNNRNRNVMFDGMIINDGTMTGEENQAIESSDEDCSAFITHNIHIQETNQVEERTTHIGYSVGNGKMNKKARRYISARTNHSHTAYIAPVMEKIKTIRGEKMPRGKKTITIQENIPEENSTLYGCHVSQASACPIYFGVKSNLHQFYDPNSNSNIHDGNEYDEADDFEYLVDPNKIHQQRCSKSLWFRVGIWAGVNLVLIGIIALSFGYFTPEKLVVVRRHENYEVLDRVAIVYNRRLELCRLAGLVVFCCGVGVLFLIIVIALLISAVCPRNNNNFCKKRCTHNTEQIIESFSITEESHTIYTEGKAKIPITEQIKQVQPNLSTPDVYRGLIRTQ